MTAQIDAERVFVKNDGVISHKHCFSQSDSLQP